MKTTILKTHGVRDGTEERSIKNWAAKHADDTLAAHKAAIPIDHPDQSVTARKIGTDAVTTDKIMNGAVTEAKIGNDAVTTNKLRNGAVVNTKIGDNAVSTSKIASGAVTADKIADSAVLTTKIADGAVTADKLGADVTEMLSDLQAIVDKEYNLTDLTGFAGGYTAAEIPLNKFVKITNDTDEELTFFQDHDEYGTALSSPIPARSSRIIIKVKNPVGGAEVENGYCIVLDGLATKQDVTNLARFVTSNQTAIATINGNDTVTGSTDKKIKDAINAFATALTNDGTVNTYKEALDWIAAHGSEYTALLGQVNTNSGVIDNLKTVAITGSYNDLVNRPDLATMLALKVDKVTGKGLSANDYTTAEKNKLAGIETGAQVNTVSPTDITNAISSANSYTDSAIATQSTNKTDLYGEPWGFWWVQFWGETPIPYAVVENGTIKVYVHIPSEILWYDDITDTRGTIYNKNSKNYVSAEIIEIPSELLNSVYIGVRYYKEYEKRTAGTVTTLKPYLEFFVTDTPITGGVNYNNKTMQISFLHYSDIIIPTFQEGETTKNTTYSGGYYNNSSGRYSASAQYPYGGGTKPVYYFGYNDGGTYRNLSYLKTNTKNSLLDAINELYDAVAAITNGTINTYKEALDWIAAHGSEYTALLGQVNTNSNSIENKVDKVMGKGLSTNDFTDEYQEIVDTADVDLPRLEEFHGRYDDISTKTGDLQIYNIGNGRGTVGQQIPTSGKYILHASYDELNPDYENQGYVGRLYISDNAYYELTEVIPYGYYAICETIRAAEDLDPDPSINGQITVHRIMREKSVAILWAESENNVADIIETITYADIVTKVNDGELVPGQQYRITDYVTTTAQANTQSAGHAFDIIVTADSTDTLNENARAVLHEGDTYFASQNLAAWELKYDINNDTAKYAWASSSGKGVIYEMTDEYGNTAPYDFKNIQFKRYKISSQSKGNDMAWLVNSYAGRYSVTQTSSKMPSFASLNTSDSIYMFTFGIRTTTGVISDASLNASGKYCYENVIEPYYYNNKRYLNGITFHNTSATQNMYGNEFDANCRDMWFYSNCYANEFKDNCFSNTFGQSCNINTFGQNCNTNTFGQGCNINTFGQGCYSNTFGQNCNTNTFGQGCYSNTFGQNCGSNTFGQNCYSNTFGQGCFSNTFGQGCFSNTFGQYCYSNTFGQSCFSNTFGQGCFSNTFGQDCNSNTFGQYCSSNTFGQGCYSNTFADSSWGNKALSNATGIIEPHPTPESFVCKEFGVIPPQEWKSVETDDYLGYNGTFYNATAMPATLTIDYEIEISYTEASGREMGIVTGSKAITIQPYSSAIAACTVLTSDIPSYEDYDSFGVITATASYSVGDADVVIKNLGT